MDTLSLINLIGGVLLLYFGVELVSEHIQTIAGDKFRRLLSDVTSNPLKGVIAGTFVTGIVQSSTVTSVILVTLVNAGILTLQQSGAVLLGAGIGGTVIVQLIAFRILQYSMLFIALGLLVKFAGRTKNIRSIGETILGFGFIFFSIQLMTLAVKPLSSNPLFEEVIAALAKAPIYGVIISTAFTALVQNSAVTIGLAIALALQNLISLPDAIPLILGANLGVCAVTMISAVGGRPDAKRVAGIQTLFKFLGVLIFFPIMNLFAGWVSSTSTDVARQIANAHTFFNITIAILFLPFLKLFTHITKYLVPDTPGEPDPSQPKYLDENTLSNPSLALGESVRESLRMADTVLDMFRYVIPAFETNDKEEIRRVSEKDDIVDSLETAIKLYITQLTSHNLSTEQSKRQITVLSSIMNLENIGDIIDKNLMELALKKLNLKVHFSEAGWRDISELHRRVLENMEWVISAYAARDMELAEKVLENKPQISKLERDFRQAHIERLRKELKESIETSEIHLDVLTNIKRINSHVTAIAYAVLDR